MAVNQYLRGDPTTGVPTEEPFLVVSTGAPDANRGVATDASGRLDASVMPVGIAASTVSAVASEALAAGDLVNVYLNAGVATVRKADASAGATKRANAYVLAAVLLAGTATCYTADINTAAAGMTIGEQFLSATTPGKSTVTPPTGAGKLVQPVGFANSATSLVFQRQTGYVLS